jgi:hypothetical protein
MRGVPRQHERIAGEQQYVTSAKAGESLGDLFILFPIG